MCTVSWFKSSNGYELFFNRDEQIKRAEASPPQAIEKNNTLVLSPIDTQAGGSWVAVNQFGLTACLLNLYLGTDLVEGDFISRGEIIRSLSASNSIEQALALLNELDLSKFRSFRALVIDASTNNALFSWDGKAFSVDRNTSSPRSSSSVDTQLVINARKLRYKQLGLQNSSSREEFMAFHREHTDDLSRSVCMHDKHRKTVSLSHICVTNSDVVFDYYQGSPCEESLLVTQKLARLGIESQSCVA